ncbi:MAG: zinc-dependent metalloprotease [Gammaproteobacteria bacterium]
MRHRPLQLCLFVIAAMLAHTADAKEELRVDAWQAMAGFIDLYWDADGGRLLLAIEDFDAPFIYQSSLARGVGSNDLGLDRGQLGATRLVEFRRVGPRVLLVQHNLSYRALAGDDAERAATAESFATSVIWGFDIAGQHDGAVFVDATGFLTRDAHGVAQRLTDRGEGRYAVDPDRSAVYLPRTKAFPDNSEAEAIVTFAGEPAGNILATVVPDPASITVHLRHSFVRLPPDGYEPLPYDPRAGVIGLSYDDGGFIDFTSAIGDPLQVNYGRRHRLEKADPTAPVSDAVEPIVYYVDRGAPEPVRSALIEGARWWNQAFEAAGYRDAFRVELLPEGADPLDVRYNVIQWVHRSTRGWSYGYSVNDPRTGEILKGHVTLGSLRVRQDYLLAEGLLAPYVPGAGQPASDDPMLAMSLARIRQLSAHEVGHTLGIEHNFAASTQDRASVMDYPFPLIRLDDDGTIDLGDAYDTGIGEWDERVILYAYQDFPAGTDAAAARERIVSETTERYAYVADGDARRVGTAHPDGNLWDNGADAIAELEHLLRVRDVVLARFGARNIRAGRPYATLEEVLVPMYLLHRYQIEAVSKLVGGRYFDYALRGDGRRIMAGVPAERQRDAIEALVGLLHPDRLRLPDHIAGLIPPRPPGFPAHRELFPRATGATFDPTAPAASAVALTLAALLEPSRAARLERQRAGDSALPGFAELLATLLEATWYAERSEGLDGLIQRRTNRQTLHALMRLGADQDADPLVRALALDALASLDEWLEEQLDDGPGERWRAGYADARRAMDLYEDDPGYADRLPQVRVPPGSPIGGGPF